MQRKVGSVEHGRAVIYAYGGIAIPALIALPLLPLLIRNLGADRFGVLSLLLAVATFSSSFDFGIGVAVARYVARFDSRILGRKSVRGLVSRAVRVQILLGTAVGLGLVVAHARIGLVATSSEDLRSEVQKAMYFLALCLPAALVAGVLRCAFEGLGRFGIANVMRTVSTASTFAVPIGASFVTQRLDVILLSLLATRAFLAVAFLAWWHRVAPPGQDRSGTRRYSRILMSYATWVTVGFLTGGVITLGVFDKVLIGRLLGAGSILEYSIPSDLIARFLLAPAAICSVLLPQLSRALACGVDVVQRSYVSGCRIVIRQAGPLAILLVLNSEWLLRALSAGHATDVGVDILHGLAVGFFLHAVAHVPHTALIACARPQLAGLRHVLELPVYCVLAYYLVSNDHVRWCGVLWAVWAAVDLVLAASFLKRAQPQVSVHAYVHEIVPYVILLIGFLCISRAGFPSYWYWFISVPVAMLLIYQLLPYLEMRSWSMVK